MERRKHNKDLDKNYNQISPKLIDLTILLIKIGKDQLEIKMYLEINDKKDRLKKLKSKLLKNKKLKILLKVIQVKMILMKLN